jgi:hypothetical protein
MKIFFIIEKGVYRHAICGPFETFEAAKEAARKMSIEESDGYHEYQVAEFGGPDSDAITLGLWRRDRNVKTPHWVGT